MSFSINLLSIYADNYAFLVSDLDLGLAMVVDPGDGEVVLRALKERELYLALILNTNHNVNHSVGNDKLQQEFGAPIIGPASEKGFIAGISRAVAHGETLSFSALRGEVLAVPGHTDGFVSYYFPQVKALFCGEALFPLGCGHLLEDNTVDMWEALKLLRALPGDTQVYCAHEYNESNAKFALAIDKNNEALKTRAAELAGQRGSGKPTVPLSLGAEVLCNPFLRADQSDLRKALAKAGVAAEDADPAAVFAMLRAAKNHWGQKAL
jgi:hydroxyacylglutathione hydrolase